MERSALLPEKPAGFGMEKPVLANEAASKQASDANNAIRSIAVFRTLHQVCARHLHEICQAGIIKPNTKVFAAEKVPRGGPTRRCTGRECRWFPLAEGLAIRAVIVSVALFLPEPEIVGVAAGCLLRACSRR